MNKIPKLITYTNKGHVEMCRNMLVSFQKVNHEIPISVYCMDAGAYEYFKDFGYDTHMANYKHCRTDCMDWGTTEYRELIQNKFPIIQKELKQTNNPVIFVDSDLFFYKDPVPYLLQMSASAPIITQTDPPHTPICTGFFMVLPDERVHKVIDKVNNYNSSSDGIYDDQLRFIRFVIEDKVPCHQLSQNLFPNGHTMFIEKRFLPDKYLVHANYMIGYETKKKALQDIGAWIV